MLPFCASALKRPRTNNVFSRKSFIGVSTLPSVMPAPSPCAHHSLLWKPLPENSAAKRTGASLPAFDGRAVSPQTRIDSIHGSAMVTPTPRKNALRLN
jgi:hypothetical protein